MELVYLKTFIEVAKTGSLTRAAENLFITTSAVSRRIKYMEEQYCCLLLDRSGPLLLPTDAGAIVLEKALQLIQIEKELLSSLSDLKSAPKFSFGCTSAFGIAHLPQVLHGFTQLYAELNNLEFNFDVPDNLVKGLQEKTFDLAVIEHCDSLDLSGFTTINLPHDEMVFVSSPRLLFGPQPIDVIELFSHTLYTKKEGCCSKKFLRLNLDRIGRSLNDFSKIVAYDDLHMIINSVTQGHGIAYISRNLVADKIADGVLAAHHVEGFFDMKNMTLVLGTTPHQNEVTVKFAREILNYFGLTGDISVNPDVAASLLPPP